MDKAKFFASVRARGSGVFGTSLSQKQVSGTEAILDEAQRRGVKLQHLAYVLGTSYHETARTMQPIEEYGRGKGRKYGAPAGPYGKAYYGRGFVQLTWLANYERASKELGVDFVRYPERVMEPRLAAEIMFTGMSEGWFTGKKLSDYDRLLLTAPPKPSFDYVNARRIINGTDKSAQIAGYAEAFEKALREAAYIGQAPKPAPIPTPPAPPADDPVVSVPPAEKVEKRGLLAAVARILATLFKRG